MQRGSSMRHAFKAKIDRGGVRAEGDHYGKCAINLRRMEWAAAAALRNLFALGRSGDEAVRSLGVVDRGHWYSHTCERELLRPPTPPTWGRLGHSVA